MGLGTERERGEGAAGIYGELAGGAVVYVQQQGGSACVSADGRCRDEEGTELALQPEETETDS